MLDLRDNGGGLVDEAQLSLAIFMPDGTIVTTRGRSRPTQTLSADGDAISTTIPLVVLVDRDTGSAAEIVDRRAAGPRPRRRSSARARSARASSRRSCALSNGGALDITVGEYFMPSGRNLGGGGVKRGAGMTPDVQGRGQPEDEARRGADARVKVARGAVGQRVEAAPRRPRRACSSSAAASSTGEPFFEPRAAASPLDESGRERRGAASSCWSGRPARAAATRKVVRGSAARTSRATCIEALMLDRGLRAPLRPGRRARRPREAARRRRRAPAPRRDLRDLPTLHDRPGHGARLRRRDLRASGSDDGAMRVWVHIADVSALRAARLARSTARRTGAARSVYVPGAVEPMLPEALSNDACSLVPGAERLAVTVELELDGRGGRASAFYRSLIRSDERLDYERVDRIFAGDERGARAVGRAAARGARGAPRRCAAAREARGRAGGRVAPSRSSRSTTRPRDAAVARAACRPSPTG